LPTLSLHDALPICGRARRRAAVPVRSREVAKRLPADEVIGEYAAFDDVDGLRLYTFAVKQVAPDETLALKILQCGVVNDRKKGRENARFVAGGEGADRTVGPTKLRLATHEVLADQGGDDVVGSIGGEQNGAAIHFFDNGSFAERNDV